MTGILEVFARGDFEAEAAEMEAVAVDVVIPFCLTLPEVGRSFNE